MQNDHEKIIVAAENLLENAEFDYLWPENVVNTLTRAANHSGDMPEFGVRATTGALKVAKAIEAENDRLCREADEKKRRRFR